MRAIGWLATVVVLLAACGGGGGVQRSGMAGEGVAVELAGTLSPQEAAAAAAGVNAFGLSCTGRSPNRVPTR